MVDLVKVSKVYLPDIQALTDVSLSINRGEIVFLIGKSGAGKSTLLRLLSRMEKQTKGVVEVDNCELSKISRNKLQRLRRNVGFAFQDFKLTFYRTKIDCRTQASQVMMIADTKYFDWLIIEKKSLVTVKVETPYTEGYSLIIFNFPLIN